MNDNTPPVIGIHIRSEYVLLMNSNDCPGKNIGRYNKLYNWFEQCGHSVMNKYTIQLLNGVKPYLFIASEIFGNDRVFYRTFDKTGGSFEGIQEAVIDLISVSSFDVFVGTPHSSYSEMASILSQPRRIYNEETNKFEFKWIYNEIKHKHMLPINRMIIPMMTTIGWVEPLILIPETKNNRPNYSENKICKQKKSITRNLSIN